MGIDNAQVSYNIPGVKHSNGTMSKPKNSRKARFLGALRVAGITMAEWAKREGVTQGYVSNLIAGRREHETLLRKIDAFIEKHLGKVAA